jgi:hypothetical protein
MKKILSLAVAFVLLSSTLLVAIPVTSSELALPDYIGVDWQSGLAGKIPMHEIAPIDNFELSEIVDLESFHSTPPVGSWAWDWYLYARADGTGYGTPYMQLRAVVGNAEVWVAEDPSLMYPDGDPRNADPENWQVTDEMAQYIAEEFADNIYPTCASYFGPPLDRDGTGTIFQAMGWPSWTYDWIETYPYNPQRVIIKIFNIEDASYWDPTYPYYVVGFYSSTYTQVYYNRNMIHIDNWAYWQRLGPEGTEWYPGREVTRPYVYDSTIAHEFQHNIHRDYQDEPAAFMNEGCSMYAELVCGYGVETAYFNSFFATPDNSLTMWGDQGDINIIADYGQAALWTIYLSDHYGGGPFITTYVQNGIPGIEGINQALDDWGWVESFFDVFHDWRLANLLRDVSGPYSYSSIDLNDPEVIPVRMYHVPGLQWTEGTDFGNTITILGYDTYISRVGSCGTDYFTLDRGFGQPRALNFDGDDVAIYGWEMTPYGWYSGQGNLMNELIYGEAYVDPADPTLTMTTYWDIEDYWDFGFVQVSTDGGMTWTSLENEYTTFDHDSRAHPDIIANLPGLTSWSMFIDPDGWITMSFDLSAYADNTILIGFRYMTDWFTTYEGWYISEAAVSGDSLELVREFAYPPASFQVTIVTVYAAGGYDIEDLSLNGYNRGTGHAMAQQPDYSVVVVSPTMPIGTTDYEFKAAPYTSRAVTRLFG